MRAIILLLATALCCGSANAFGATAVLGTSDNNPVEVRANGSRVWRIEPNATSPNLVAGHAVNFLVPGHVGETIGGGGSATAGCLPTASPGSCRNAASGDFVIIGGGAGNICA